jgi:3,2-trans-enoyl-CoA isomerase
MIGKIEHGEIRELRLDRPPANALTEEMVVTMRKEIEQAPLEGKGAIVLSGTPGMFSGGLDVPFLLTLERAGIHAFWQAFFELLKAIALSPVPIVAGITGHSPAGGTVMVIFCDARIMAEGNFRIGLNEVQVGIVVPPFVQATFRGIVGRRCAEQLLVAGRMLQSREALDVGLVDEIVPVDRVVEEALARCAELLSLPRQAMLATRKIAREDIAGRLATLSPVEVQLVVDKWFTEETQAALQALVKRLSK